MTTGVKNESAKVENLHFFDSKNDGMYKYFYSGCLLPLIFMENHMIMSAIS